jgi:radical SAM superfamily enzyme YgiQ (UPF0313 family)
LDANALLGFDTHFKVILEKIIAEKLDVFLTNYGGVGASLVNDDNVSLMVKAGFKSINIPVEDVNELVLKGWNRRTDKDTWEKAVRTAQKYTDRVRTYMMIGAPTQSMQGIMDTYNYVKDMGVEPFTLPFIPIPKTSEYENYKNMDMEDLNPSLYPCAHDGMTVRNLHRLYGECRQVPFDDLFTEKEIVDDMKQTSSIITSGPPIPEV